MNRYASGLFGLSVACWLLGFTVLQATGQEDALRGLWTIMEVDAAGLKAKSDGAFQFYETVLVVTNGDGSRDLRSYKHDASASPNLYLGDSGDREMRRGLFAIEENALQLQVTFRGGKRPQELESDRSLFFERVDEDH